MLSVYNNAHKGHRKVFFEGKSFEAITARNFSRSLRQKKREELNPPAFKQITTLNLHLASVASYKKQPNCFYEPCNRLDDSFY